MRIIAESDLMQKFLMEAHGSCVSCTKNTLDTIVDILQVDQVDLRVLFPNQEFTTVTIRRNASAELVYKAIATKLGLGEAAVKFCALYEIMESHFRSLSSLITQCIENTFSTTPSAR